MATRPLLPATPTLAAAAPPLQADAPPCPYQAAFEARQKAGAALVRAAALHLASPPGTVPPAGLLGIPLGHGLGRGRIFPPELLALARKLEAGRAPAAALAGLLHPRRIRPPHSVEASLRCKCRPLDAPACRRFRSDGVASFVEGLFHAAARGAPDVPPCGLNRFDLYHGHLFWPTPLHADAADLPRSPLIGGLLHAREFPRGLSGDGDGTIFFDLNLGYCQVGSPLGVGSRQMELRNLLWLANGVAEGLWAIDAAQVPELLINASPCFTVDEGDLGAPLVDVYLFPTLPAETGCKRKLFVVPRIGSS